MKEYEDGICPSRAQCFVFIHLLRVTVCTQGTKFAWQVAHRVYDWGKHTLIGEINSVCCCITLFKVLVNNFF